MPCHCSAETTQCLHKIVQLFNHILQRSPPSFGVGMNWYASGGFEAILVLGLWENRWTQSLVNSSRFGVLNFFPVKSSAREKQPSSNILWYATFKVLIATPLTEHLSHFSAKSRPEPIQKLIEHVIIELHYLFPLMIFVTSSARINTSLQINAFFLQTNKKAFTICFIEVR